MVHPDDDPATWHPVSVVQAVIEDPKWRWIANAACKYVSLRIDTRDMRCLILDRDGNTISLNQLRRQHKAAA